MPNSQIQSFGTHPGKRMLYRKRRKKKTRFFDRVFLWCILIAMVARTTILVRQRDTSQFSAVDMSAIWAIILVGVAIAAILLNPRTQFCLNRISRSSTVFLLLYYLLCLISSLWSFRPSYTGFRAFEVLSVLSLAFVAMAYCENFLKAEKVFLRFSLLTIILAFVMKLKLAGGLSISGLHTNLYTIIAGAGSIYCYGERNFATPKRRKVLTIYAIVFLFFLIIGTSAASNIATTIGFIVTMALIGKRNYLTFAVIIVACGYFYISGSFEELVMQALLPNKEVGDIQTMTGRTHLWSAYITLFQKEPIAGFGFAVVARLGSVFNTVSTTNAHNGYFEVILGTGLIGASVFITWLATLGFSALQAYRANAAGSVGIIGAFTVVFANNMSKSIIGGAFDPSLVAFMVLLAFFIFFIEPQKNRKKIPRNKVKI